MSDDARPTGRGQIGVEIFEQVEKMVAEDKITRSEAFQRLSESTGRRAGTVAANYYRVARSRGVTTPRRRRGSGRARGRAAVRGGDVQAALNRVSAALDELSAAVRRQDQELGRLRDENASYDQIRRLMKRVK